MSISFIPQIGGNSNESPSPTYGDVIPVIDAHLLYDQCVEMGIETGWWSPVANTVTLKAGEEPSVAYLLLTKKYIDGASSQDNAGTAVSPINRNLYNHRIALQDSVRIAERITSPFYVDGWVFHSMRAIDGSQDATDLNAVYLVKFVDKRWLFAKQPGIVHVSGSAVVVEREYHYPTSPTTLVDEGEMDYDPSSEAEFPYESHTAESTALLPTWEQLLEKLWLSANTLSTTTGATLSFQDAELPSGGEYPNEVPHDISFDKDTTWQLFCKLLHASGNELYPLLDGTFRIKPIDDAFLNEEYDTLSLYDPYLIEQGHTEFPEELLPVRISMTFGSRIRSDNVNTVAQTNSYVTPILLATSDLLTAEEIADSGCDILSGTYADGEFILGAVEDVITPAMQYAESIADVSSFYTNYIGSFADTVLTRYLKSRIDGKVDATYGRFIDLTPSPKWEEVTFFIANGGPCTHFKSLPASVGVTELPGGGSGGIGGVDRLVAADSTDDTPAELIDKIEDLDTYDELVHQIVWADVVEHGTDPEQDNKIRFFTTIGTGEQGPQGEQGPPGADGPTYSEGCGIIIAGTTIYFDPVDAAGPGLQDDPYDTTTCSLAVKPEDIVGCGLQVAADNAAREEVKIKINPTDLFSSGGGLMAATGNTTNHNGPCKLKINPVDLAGCGLVASTDNTDAAAGPVKINLNPTAIVGDGLAVQGGNQGDTDGPCKIKVNPNVTIKVPTSIELNLSSTQLEVKLNYTEYQIYGVVGISSSMSDAVTVDECP